MSAFSYTSSATVAPPIDTKREKKDPLFLTEKQPAYTTEDETLGWRYSTRVLPDGTRIRERHPLTILDILFPEEGDEVSIRNRHAIIQTSAYNAMSMSCRNNPSMVAFKEMRIDFGLPNLRPLTPDAALVSGITKPKDYDWSTFYVKEEGATVELVLEVTSPATRHIDVEPSLLTPREQKMFQRQIVDYPTLRSKWEIYAEAGVLVYIVIDNPEDKEDGVPLLYVYHLNALRKMYTRCYPDSQGRFWIHPLRMYIARGTRTIDWFDDTEHEVVDYARLTDAYQETKQARKIAEERATYAVKRLDQAMEAQHQTVRNMVAKGFELSFIAELTGLSLDDIAALVDLQD